MNARNIIIFALLVVLSGYSFAQQPVLSLVGMGASVGTSPSEKSRLDLDKQVAFRSKAQSAEKSIVFLEGSTPVVGIQFDLQVEAGFAEKAVLACGSKLESGHSLTCNKIDERTVRVIVFSLANKEVRSGSLLTLPRGLSRAKFVDGSIHVGDANAERVDVEVL